MIRRFAWGAALGMATALGALSPAVASAMPTATASRVFAGYRLDSAHDSDLELTWGVPHVRCGSTPSSMRIYGEISNGPQRVEVGIIGTCLDGKAHWHGYLSLGGRVRVPFGRHAHADDLMEAEISAKAITLTDVDAGWGSSAGSTGHQPKYPVVTVGAAVNGTGSEAIALADFRPLILTHCFVNGQDMSTLGARRIQLRDSSGNLEASVSAWRSPAAFTITRSKEQTSPAAPSSSSSLGRPPSDVAVRQTD